MQEPNLTKMGMMEWWGSWRASLCAEKDLQGGDRMKISILGPVGSGKGTQSQRISQRLNWTRISTGDLVRDQIEADTPLGRKLKEDNDQGDPVPDDVVIKLALPNLQPSGGWILDDCPRTMEQARLLDKELEKRSSGLSHVIVLEGPSDDELIERITSGRRTSPATTSWPVAIWSWWVTSRRWRWSYTWVRRSFWTSSATRPAQYRRT